MRSQPPAPTPDTLAAAPPGDGSSVEREMAEALARAERAARRRVEHLHEIVFEIDDAGRLVFLNAAFTERLGFGVEQALGQPVAAFAAPDDRERCAALLGSVAATGAAPVRADIRFASATGEVVWTEMSVAASPDGGAVGSLHDLTASKRAEDELVRAREAALEASRAKSRFLASMSHELRTPMHGVLGGIELVLESELAAPQRELLATVRRSAEALLAIVDGILDLSKIEARHVELDRGPIQIAELVVETLRALAPSARRRSVELVAAIASDVPDVVVGDAGRVRQVLTNLVGNALEHASGSDVTVSVRRSPNGGDDIGFAVEDEGPGIAPERLPSLFGDDDAAEPPSSEVLGLAICRELVELMAGKLCVDSVPGRGTTFHVSLPLPALPAPAWNTPSASPLAGRSISVVDPSRAVRASVDAMLAALGADTRSYASLDDALAATTEPLDALLIDEASAAAAPELLARVAARGPSGARAPVVLLLHPLRAAARDRASLGEAAQIVKPVSRSALRQALLGTLASTAAAPVVDLPPPSAIEVATRPLRVLVAEDNAVNAMIILALLSKLGHQATQVDDGEQALERVAVSSFDVVLMDVEMPVLDGLEATRRIRARERERGGHVPVVALTANAMKGYDEVCLAAGMDGYTAKPVSLATLRTALAAACPPSSGA